MRARGGDLGAARGARALVLDAGCVVSTITQYPTYATFFSTAEKLSLGGMPFVVADDEADAARRARVLPRRRAALRLDVRQYERGESRSSGASGAFVVHSDADRGASAADDARAPSSSRPDTSARPTCSACRARTLPHVSHVYREGHDAFQQDVVVVGGGNSAAEAALDLWRAGARVTLVHFGPTFDKKIKPWVLPDVENRIAEGSIGARWNSRVTSIEPGAVAVRGAGGRRAARRATTCT